MVSPMTPLPPSPSSSPFQFVGQCATH
jgi:hypothetical protein